MLVLFAFLPGVFDGFNAMIDAGGAYVGAALPVPGCWLAPSLSITRVRLPCWSLQSCCWLWTAEVCTESGFTQLHQPKQHPQSIAGENIVKWKFSSYGETPSSAWGVLLCELYSVPSGEMLINQWTGSGTMFRWGCVVYPQGKEVRQQITEQNKNFWPSFSHHIPKYSSCDQHFVCLWKASCAGVGQKKIKRCKEEQTVQVNKNLVDLLSWKKITWSARCHNFLDGAFWLWNLAVNLQNPQLFLNTG